MKAASNIKRPEWYERKNLVCKKCGRMFRGVKIPLITKCPSCGRRSVKEDPWVRY